MVLVGAAWRTRQPCRKALFFPLSLPTIFPLAISLPLLSSFVGFGDHIRDDILCRHVVISVESIGWTFFHARDAAPPSWVMKQVARHCSPFLSSHLSHIISSINLANSFTSFSAPYSDTIYLIVENFMNLDATANFTLKEQTRMSQIAWMSRLNTPSSRVNGE